MNSDVVVVAMLALMLGALFGGLLNRWLHGKSIGHRFIQFVGLAWLIGATVILALEKAVDGVAGTILGAIAGYLFGMQRHDGDDREGRDSRGSRSPRRGSASPNKSA